MRSVYAHFPINCHVTEGNRLVEIRNFLGEKFVRRVSMLEGVTCTPSSKQKDELILEGNNLELVSRSGRLSHIGLLCYWQYCVSEEKQCTSTPTFSLQFFRGMPRDFGLKIKLIVVSSPRCVGCIYPYRHHYYCRVTHSHIYPTNRISFSHHPNQSWDFRL